MNRYTVDQILIQSPRFIVIEKKLSCPAWQGQCRLGTEIDDLCFFN